MYDYVIVGAGFFGSVFARQMTDAGAKCLVIEKRSHIAGNCYTDDVDGIHVHQYGPHIFHTNDEGVWNFVNRFARFSRFSYRPKVNFRGRMLSFPINLTTLHQLWGVKTPQEAERRLQAERIPIENPANLEEWVLSQVGRELYETFVYGYTKKQWGREPKTLPSSIIRRLPIRLTWNDDYFNDRFCGIPEGGYTQLFQKLLSGIPVETNVDFLADRCRFESRCKQVVYTGPLDRLFEYELGANDWRGLRFQHQVIQTADHQGIAAINYTDAETPYTRSVEHKHFDPVQSDHTVITHEYPADWQVGDEMYYPVNNEQGEQLQQRYLAMLPKNYLVGGRLATYRYYDMHQVIASALHLATKEIARDKGRVLRTSAHPPLTRRAA
ncbi:UDP-galactopyranose mutase [Novipirellula galeiformis]|uniref:UDP-galactopyranose mutase n=1 Tax=Novipirellula galeiformis TaxID=2528004 RepID=A0A5C6CHJ4_9BACT|nr:UDP-galactopyranose mutase [Novipirellula galeiformis]TWU23044.1 UDP-galactopyranose mutase [Novipirellula galeiformis]